MLICTESEAMQVSTATILVILLDHLVSGGQQRLRDGEAERVGGLEVDDQLDFYGLLDRQIGWFLAFENAPGINANLAEPIAEAAAKAHHAAGEGELTEWVNRGQRMAGRQRGELFGTPVEEGAAADQDRPNALLR